jgi:hypothetical protein
MRRNRRFWTLGGALTLAAALMLLTTFALAASSGKPHPGRKAQHVRWDIVSLVGGNPPGPFNPGGHASASAPDGDTITLTGSGTFVAPASGKGSRAARGGGTWTTSMGGSGTYRVTRLVSWEFANFQATTPMFIDNINHGRRSNGTAVLNIRFSDGSRGVLTVGCHGPGAPPGIFEGIATTKDYKTYYAVQPPVAGVDANRTLFHVRR